MLRQLLLIALGMSIGLSAGTYYGAKKLIQFKDDATIIFVSEIDDAYILGRQSVAFDCIDNGYALLPPRKKQTTPAVLICGITELVLIPEEDVDELQQQLNKRQPEIIPLHSI